MNIDLVCELNEIKQGLYDLHNQIEGAIYMLDCDDPTGNFLKYVQQSLSGFHCKIAWKLTTNKNSGSDIVE